MAEGQLLLVSSHGGEREGSGFLLLFKGHEPQHDRSFAVVTSSSPEDTKGYVYDYFWIRSHSEVWGLGLQHILSGGTFQPRAGSGGSEGWWGRVNQSRGGNGGQAEGSH